MSHIGQDAGEPDHRDRVNCCPVQEVVKLQLIGHEQPLCNYAAAQAALATGPD